MSNNTSDFQNELNNIVSEEDKQQQKNFETAKLKAKWDFESLKKQFRFIVSQKEYLTDSSGNHQVTVMFPQYPNTIERCEVNEYLTFKESESKALIKTGLFSKSFTTVHSLHCIVTDSESFDIYKQELYRLCNEENISCKIVATPSCKYSSTLGLSSEYKYVPGCIESNKTFITNSYHIRLCASMEF